MLSSCNDPVLFQDIHLDRFLLRCSWLRLIEYKCPAMPGNPINAQCLIGTSCRLRKNTCYWTANLGWPRMPAPSAHFFLNLSSIISVPKATWPNMQSSNGPNDDAASITIPWNGRFWTKWGKTLLQSESLFLPTNHGFYRHACRWRWCRGASQWDPWGARRAPQRSGGKKLICWFVREVAQFCCTCFKLLFAYFI